MPLALLSVVQDRLKETKRRRTDIFMARPFEILLRLNSKINLTKLLG